MNHTANPEATTLFTNGHAGEIVKPPHWASRLSALLAAGATIALLTGCGSKPPGCADAETIETARGLLIEHSQKFQTSINTVPDDPDGWTKKYYDALKIELSGIVSDGYKADAKKQMCKGTVKVSTINNQSFAQTVEYTTQRTEDDKTGFLLEITGADETFIKTGTDAQTYLEGHRWSGDWNGTYACSGYRGATEGPQGPYRVPVTMVVKGREGLIERTTLGGGAEVIASEFLPGARGTNTIFHAEGKGRNTPEDIWFTKFDGKVQGKQITAEGGISTAGEGRVRLCQLELTLGAPPTAQAVPAAAPAPSAKGLVGKFSGPGEGLVTVEVGNAQADGKHPVTVGTSVQGSSGPSCGGAVEGLGIVDGTKMLFVGVRDGERCETGMSLTATGQLSVEEGSGCGYFHGAACGFTGTLDRTR